MNLTMIFTIFVAVIAIAVLLQVVILAGMLNAIRRVHDELTQMQQKVNEQAVPLLAKLRLIVDDGAPKIQTTLTNLAETSTVIRQQAATVDRTVTEISDVVREQTAKAGLVASRTLERIDFVAEVLQHSVLSPARHISALIDGLMAGIGQFMAGRRGQSAKKASPSDEMFI